MNYNLTQAERHSRRTQRRTRRLKIAARPFSKFAARMAKQTDRQRAYEAAREARAAGFGPSMLEKVMHDPFFRLMGMLGLPASALSSGGSSKPAAEAQAQATAEKIKQSWGQNAIRSD